MEQLPLLGIGQSLADKENLAIDLLKEHEPEALKLAEFGFFLGFSGGKDSIVIEHLARRAGVKFKSLYSQTTIDPPELIRFIKQYYPHVEWRRPKRNFFKAVMDSHGLPSRMNRWCCEEFKEDGGDGFIKILGVRAAESPRRKKLWGLVTRWRSELGGYVIAPIVYWSDDDVWTYIRKHKLPYCSLYDEGFLRLGCVGCPMAGQARRIEFARWPGFEKAWRFATQKYFDSRKGRLNRLGKPFYIERFKTADEFFNWWLSEKPSKLEENECLGLGEYVPEPEDKKPSHE